MYSKITVKIHRNKSVQGIQQVQFRAAKVMEEWNILTAAMFFYYADGVKEKNANEEHFSTLQAPNILFLGNKWSQDLGGAKGG